MSTAPTSGQRMATAAETGRACPYCRFPLKEGDSVRECGTCHSLHHSDCWSDNTGCAIVGCAGSDDGAATAVLPPSPGAPPPPPAQGPPGHLPPAATPARREPWLVLALFVLALAIAGAGAAYFVTAQDKDEDPPREVARQTTPTTTAPAPAPNDVVEEPPAETPGDLTDADRAEIERVLSDYYDAIRNGDYETAWGLLSPSYRDWKTSAGGGRAKWRSQEAATNAAHLGSTSGLTVEIEDYDAATEVATIYVSGLTYGEGCDYKGYTWARRVEGSWYYDQGYLQDADRAREWRPRQDETLGVPCEEGAY